MNILITGACSGINYNTLLMLVKKNYYIYATTHTNNEANELKRKFKKYKNVFIFKLDINNNDDISKVSNLNIDVLISSSAIGNGGSIIDCDIGYLESNFKTNLFDNFKLIKTILNNMIKKDRGKIIITSSVAGIIPIPYLGIYASTKASISMLAKVLRDELKIKNSKVSVSIIEPGIYNTGFNDFMFLKAYEISKNKFIMFENKMFNFFGKNNLNSISKEYIKCIKSSHSKKIYRAPFFTRILVKVYLLICG